MNKEKLIIKGRDLSTITSKNAKRIAWLLRLCKIPIIGSEFRKEIPKLFIHAKNVEISRDFFCINGNIDAEDVGLHDTFCVDWGLIKIGQNTAFSNQNMILTSTHDLEKFNEVIVKPVSIGANVWITCRVIILPGVSIGDNSVIGAGSIVTKDIPEGVFAAGNPCKPIKKIDRGKTKWWKN